jgi:hypothetical protein
MTSGPFVYSEALMILRGLVLVLFAPVALLLGLLPARLFVPRELAELKDDGETWIVEGTAHVELL